MDFADLLKGVAAAARNPLAFVAYLAALVAWVTLRFRVDRNKNLLGRLTALPAKDRAQVLRDEMGIWDSGEALNAEQRIRSRVHRYYFFAFLVLCGVVVVLFAIAIFNRTPIPKPGDGPNVIRKVELVNPSAPSDPELLAFTRKVETLELGVGKENVRGAFGTPTHAGKFDGAPCFDYKTPFAKLLFIFDKGGEATFIYVVATDPGFQPRVYSWSAEGGANDSDRLGHFSFEDITSHSFVPADDPPIHSALEVTPNTFFVNDGGAHGTAIYVEVEYGTPAQQAVDFTIWTSDGLYTGGSDSPLKLIQALEDRTKGNNTYWDGMAKDDILRLNQFRATARPNAYAMSRTVDESVSAGPINKRAVDEFPIICSGN